jgi:hypothetical protein
MSRTAAATQAVQRYAAERAVDDPAKLAKAARIVRAALARHRLSLDDLTPLPAPDRNLIPATPADGG